MLDFFSGKCSLFILLLQKDNSSNGDKALNEIIEKLVKNVKRY